MNTGNLSITVLKTTRDQFLTWAEAVVDKSFGEITKAIKDSQPDAEYFLLEGSKLTKSFEPEIKKVIRSYAFGIPQELQEAAKEAAKREREVFLQLASGQAFQQETEAEALAESSSQRTAALWNELYKLYLNSGLEKDQAARKVEKDLRYVRQKKVLDSTLAYRERILKEAYDERIRFNKLWKKLLKPAREKKIPVPESRDELEMFWVGSKSQS